MRTIVFFISLLLVAISSYAAARTYQEWRAEDGRPGRSYGPFTVSDEGTGHTYEYGPITSIERTEPPQK
jgi:hypothetical protein